MSPEEYFLEIGASALTNKAGESAAAKAAELRSRFPVRSLLARILRQNTDESAWAKGARGERLVAKELERLRPGWCVLHDVKVSAAGHNIDHVVIGPGGVFTLNAKNHHGSRIWVAGNTLMVNGNRTDYARKARREAERASRLLSRAAGTPVSVRGLIVVMAEDLRVKHLPADVNAVGRIHIARWLTQLPRELTAETVRSISAKACDPATWLPDRRRA